MASIKLYKAELKTCVAALKMSKNISLTSQFTSPLNIAFMV